MNEQIKAIGRQAGFAFIADGVYGQRWYSSKCGMDAAEYEKLVELIVRECKENFAKVWYEQGMDIRGAEIDKFLTRFDEHFGVEE